MSFFDEPNQDALSVSPETAARGPLVGFLDSFSVGWQQQTRAAAMYGIEDRMWSLDNEQRDAMRRAGLENVPTLMRGFGDNVPPEDVSKYLDAARFYTDGGDPAFASQLADYDKRIGEVREKYPELNLKTSREMWDSVKAEAQEYEARASNDRRTIAGTIGVYAGGAAGSLNPNTDPLNFITLGVGGAGKTAVTRIVGQGVGQGAIEAVNELTGVQEERRLLGLEHGFGDAVSRVTGAALGGAALQGIGEGVSLGIRRWFRSAPNDPAPLPPSETLNRPAVPDTSQVAPTTVPTNETLAAAKLVRDPETYIDLLHDKTPLSNSRAGRARTVLDLDYATTRLNDWEGDAPWALAPKTDTTLTLPRSDFVAPDLHPVADRMGVDDLARRIDPETFAKYDALAQRKETFRRWIDELGQTRDDATQARIDAVDKDIDALTLKMQEQSGRRAAKTRKDIAALEAKKEGIATSALTTDTPDMAKVRQDLMRHDEKMRDLAPLVSRAYARARGEWASSEAERRAVIDMMRRGDTKLPLEHAEAVRAVDAAERSLTERAPILKAAPSLPKPLPAKADGVDVAAAIVAEHAKVLDEAIERYRGALEETTKLYPNGEIQIEGHTRKLNLDTDTIYVPHEDGTGGREISIRDLLNENKMDEHELEAVTSCSPRKTS